MIYQNRNKMTTTYKIGQSVTIENGPFTYSGFILAVRGTKSNTEYLIQDNSESGMILGLAEWRTENQIVSKAEFKNWAI